jgi:cytidylate kinase
MDMNNVIAIDGPAASGKSTLGFLLARRLGYLYLDTGSMYRALTLAALQDRINIDDEAALARLAEEVEIDVRPLVGKGDKSDGRHYSVFLDGEDVTWKIRTPEVDAAVSKVSSYPSVRRQMVLQQRRYAMRGDVVMVGRDIGTVVVPEAQVKLYITATPQERANRRWLERRQQGHSADYEVILADVIRRDEFDAGRQHSPMQPAADAIEIDTTGKPVEAVIEAVASLVASGLPVQEAAQEAGPR